MTASAASDPASSDVSDGRDNSRAGVREREQQRKPHAHGTRPTSGAKRKYVYSLLYNQRFSTAGGQKPGLFLSFDNFGPVSVRRTCTSHALNFGLSFRKKCTTCARVRLNVSCLFCINLHHPWNCEIFVLVRFSLGACHTVLYVRAAVRADAMLRHCCRTFTQATWCSTIFSMYAI